MQKICAGKIDDLLLLCGEQIKCRGGESGCASVEVR